MNIASVVFRLIIALTYFSLSIRMFRGAHAYAGWASIFIGLVILFPVIRLLYKRIQPLPVDVLKDDIHYHPYKIAIWLRKALAIFFGMTVVGSIERNMNATGLIILLICLIILTPLEPIVFDQSIFRRPSDPSERNGRGVLIMLGRNLGVILYITGTVIFSDHNFDPPAMGLLIAGLVLLFTGPIVKLFTS